MRRRVARSACLGGALGLLIAGEAGSAAPWRRITSNPAIDAMPSLFPDGTRIAFHSRRSTGKHDRFPTRRIWLTDISGSRSERLGTGRAEEYQPAVSPDGERIAFVSEAQHSRDIWLMKADGSGAAPLTDAPGLEVSPAWSPDGKQIAYAALPAKGGSFDLWVMYADGSGQRRVTSAAADEIFPCWHPDGHRIAYVSNNAGQFDIYVLDLRAQHPPSPLLASSDHETRPRFSPDGTKIVYARWPERGSSREARLWIANADGSAAREIPAPPGSVAAVWLPDGLSLVAQSRQDDNWDLWLVPLPTTLTRPGRLLPPRGPGGERAELEDGRTLNGGVLARAFRLHTAYGEFRLHREVVSEIRFDRTERGLARVTLANGDRLSGFLLAHELRLALPEGIRRIPVGSLSRLVVGGSAAPSGPEQIVLRNGDVLTGRLRRRDISLRVGGKVISLPVAEIRSLDAGRGGLPSRAVTRRGEIVEGTLVGRRWTVDLAIGARVDVPLAEVARLTHTR